jgi:hypothetical protein
MPVENLTRRHLVGSAGGLSLIGAWGPAGAVEPAPATTGSLLETLIERRARLDGKPAFWVTRGTQLAIIDGKSIPLAGRLVMSAWRFKDLGNGAYDIPYVECFVTTEPSTFRFLTKRPNPITGGTIETPIPEADLHVMHMDKSGAMSQTKKRADGGVSRYEGVYFGQRGFDGQTWVTEKCVVTTTAVNGDVGRMTEVTTIMPKGKPVDGYMPAEMTQTAFMSAIPLDISGGKAGAIVGYYYSRKCPNPKAIRDEIDGENAEVAEHFFKNWESLMP